jgi:5-formyltetrahydrofolate cyclo-ligase
MPTTEETRQWRRSRRSELLAWRHRITREERRRARRIINEKLQREFPKLRKALIGYYWPIKDEIDVLPAVEGFLGDGARAALPVIVERRAPLEFWTWRPGMAMDLGVWDIPVPAEREVVHPSVLLVPLLGFDADGFRLGYGGGYYDRTLAVLDPKPFTIGIGYKEGRIETVFPQEHDIPLDAIVTEA